MTGPLFDQTAIYGISMAVVAIMTAFNNRNQARAEKKQDATAKQVVAIHTLSNSAMAAQLKLNVQFAMANSVDKHRIADLTKQEGDVASAAAADIIVEDQKALLQKHMVQQATVDATAAKEC